jgi:hypothetical protein
VDDTLLSWRIAFTTVSFCAISSFIVYLYSSYGCFVLLTRIGANPDPHRYCSLLLGLRFLTGDTCLMADLHLVAGWHLDLMVTGFNTSLTVTDWIIVDIYIILHTVPGFAMLQIKSNVNLPTTNDQCCVFFTLLVFIAILQPIILFPMLGSRN